MTWPTPSYFFCFFYIKLLFLNHILYIEKSCTPYGQQFPNTFDFLYIKRNSWRILLKHYEYKVHFSHYIFKWMFEHEDNKKTNNKHNTKEDNCNQHTKISEMISSCSSWLCVCCTTFVLIDASIACIFRKIYMLLKEIKKCPSCFFVYSMQSYPRNFTLFSETC